MSKADLDRAAEARALEDTARTAGADRPALLSQAAEHWTAAGEHAHAVDLLYDVAALTGDPADAASPVLARALFAAGREAEGRAVADAAARHCAETGDWREWEQLAEHLDLAGRPTDALDALDRALALVLCLPEPDAPLPDAPALRPLSHLTEL